MRIWAKIIQDHKIKTDVVQEFALARPSDIAGWTPMLHALCQALDLARPVVLQKHINELAKFNRTVFRKSDFIDTIPFDSFELEIIPEKKKHGFTDPIAY